MSYTLKNQDLVTILASDYERMNRIAKRLEELEHGHDEQVFRITHIFVNVAAPIRGFLQLGKTLEEIIAACDYAIDRMKSPIDDIDDCAVQTVHSESFLTTQKNYLGILVLVKNKILKNKYLLEGCSKTQPTPPTLP